MQSIGWRCAGWAGARMRRMCIWEVCLRLLRDTTDYRDDEHLKAWLLRVTVNCSDESASVGVVSAHCAARSRTGCCGTGT